MNNKKSIFNKIILIYIIIQPILDALSGISDNVKFFDFKINIIVRGLFLLFMGIYLLFMCKSKYRKFNYIYLIVLFLYYVLYGCFIFMYSDKNLLLMNMKQSILVYYFPITLLALFNMREEKLIKLEDKYLVIALSIYLVLIIIPSLLGISFDAYSTDGAGKLGFFYSANSISVILSMLLPCSIILFKDNKKFLLGFLVLFCLGIFTIGTKTVILSLLIILFINFIYYFKSVRKTLDIKKKLILFISLLVVLAGLVIIVPKTAVYDNIERRIKFLDIKDTHDVIDNFDALVLGRRLKFLSGVNNFYKQAKLPQKVFGIGYYNNGIKLVEMDYFDIFYCNGLIGFVVFFIPLIYIFKTKYKKKAKNIIRINRFSSLLIILLTSFLTGHVLVEPNASFYVALLIIMFND